MPKQVGQGGEPPVLKQGGIVPPLLPISDIHVIVEQRCHLQREATKEKDAKRSQTPKALTDYSVKEHQ